MKLVTILLALTLTGCGFHYSDGERVGYITKFSKKGFIWKTWEGEMRIGGVTDGNGSIQSELWPFSVKVDGPAKEIEASMKAGGKTTLRYSQEFYFWGNNGETSHFITEVVKQ